jgi:hypothetical protein
MKLFKNNITLLKKFLAILFMLFLMSCTDKGCTEGDDFGEFTIQNLQFPPYAGISKLDYNKTICNDYNKNLLKNINVDLCEDNTSRSCFSSAIGNDQNCKLNQAYCSSIANIYTLQNKCFSAYEKKQTSSGGLNYVYATHDEKNNPNFSLLSNSDISVKIRGEITINRAGGQTGLKKIKENFDLADKLIEAGGKKLLNSKDKNGRTALHDVCSDCSLIYKRIEFINKLIENPDLEFCKDSQVIPYNASDHITNQILVVENIVISKIYEIKTKEGVKNLYFRFFPGFC